MSEDTREFTKMEDTQLQKFITQADGAISLIESSFFIDVLIPRLEKEMDDVRSTIEWRPGKTAPDIQQIGTSTVWLSGIIQGMEKLWDELNNIKKDGTEARKELERRADLEKEKKK